MVDPELAVQIAVAIGTIGAVVVALFQSQLRLKFAPPRLTISLLSPRGYRTDVHLFPPGTNELSQSRIESARFYHIQVENKRRWSTANQVQVFLTRIDMPGPDGDMRIAWLGEVPMRWRYQDANPIARTIGPDAQCDLCSVVKEKFLRLETLIRPTELPCEWREPTNVVVYLQARSVEVDSPVIRVKIAWDGKWQDGDLEMGDHMVVEQISGD